MSSNTTPPKKSTVFTSRRMAIWLGTIIFGVLAMQFPAVEEHIPELLAMMATVIGFAMTSFGIADIDWGQKVIDVSQGAITQADLDRAQLIWQAKIERELTAQIDRLIAEIRGTGNIR